MLNEDLYVPASEWQLHKKLIKKNKIYEQIVRQFSVAVEMNDLKSMKRLSKVMQAIRRKEQSSVVKNVIARLRDVNLDFETAAKPPKSYIQEMGPTDSYLSAKETGAKYPEVKKLVEAVIKKIMPKLNYTIKGYPAGNHLGVTIRMKNWADFSYPDIKAFIDNKAWNLITSKYSFVDLRVVDSEGHDFNFSALSPGERRSKRPVSEQQDDPFSGKGRWKKTGENQWTTDMDDWHDIDVDPVVCPKCKKKIDADQLKDVDGGFVGKHPCGAKLKIIL